MTYMRMKLPNRQATWRTNACTLSNTFLPIYVRNTPPSDGVVWDRRTGSAIPGYRFRQMPFAWCRHYSSVLDFTGEIPGGKRQECGKFLARRSGGRKGNGTEERRGHRNS